MLTFRLYRENVSASDRAGTIHIDPLAVVSVEEAERRPAFGGWHQVAVVTLSIGDRHVVEDGARTAARLIADARGSAHAAGT
jgi:hypothetical protein